MTDDDDDQTSICDGPSRRKKSTKRGYEGSEQTPMMIDAPPQRDRSEPIRVISMKTPQASPARRAIKTKAHKVKLRAMSDLDGGRLTPPRGHLAPPRDAKQARARRTRDLVIWSCAVIVIGSIVMIAVWLIARR